ncbi:PTS system mannose/fructose/sorbose family transporter subunit IID [Lacticaseibacillus zhaodongensis]|uniref:PTS system mannose/fructose/sorbose family transporter subunit IID n=1 Tax=Lacticaseibacillus zhaodongensis TaxID=2668065 RepID=UPI0012D2F9B6|nr:PTS system mannose/fructose/sorbose family transporter subunit IID [Lacticaseibacillus zhaodongensis]
MTANKTNDTESSVITKKTLHHMFFRSLMYGASWNYERMQNLGFLYTILPALKKIYVGDKPGLATAMKRHLEFFNTHQSAQPFILGVITALEEKEKNKSAETISGLKVGLMGPLSGLGDSLIWLTLVPICFSLGASFGKQGNFLGIAIALILVNIINLSIKYFGLQFGYHSGSEFFTKVEANGDMDRITSSATALGLVLVGGLIAQMVAVNIAWTFKQGGLTVSVQKQINDLIPGFIPMGVTLLLYKFIHKGKSPVMLILVTMVVAIALTALGVLK